MTSPSLDLALAARLAALALAGGGAGPVA
jgi:hypothetical protein